MKSKTMSLRIAVIALLIVSLCISTTGFTQQKPNDNSITKDISLTHIDSNTTLNLDLSKHLGLTAAEIKKLTNALSVDKKENVDASNKGVMIELLKPVNTSVHHHTLVISEIKTNPTRNIDVRVKIKEQEWLNSKALSDKIKVEFDKDNVPFLTDILGPQNTVLLKIYNPTKSRINLKDWQIRITYGPAPTITAVRVIDKMSNVNKDVWQPLKKHIPIDQLNHTYSVILSRKIDYKLLNDPTKTQDEQLSSISDGTHQTGWNIKTTPNLTEWVEIRDPQGKLQNLKDGYILFLPSKNIKAKDLPKVDTRIIFSPRKPANDPLPPTDDR